VSERERQIKREKKRERLRAGRTNRQKRFTGQRSSWKLHCTIGKAETLCDWKLNLRQFSNRTAFRLNNFAAGEKRRRKWTKGNILMRPAICSNFNVATLIPFNLLCPKNVSPFTKIVRCKKKKNCQVSLWSKIWRHSASPTQVLTHYSVNSDVRTKITFWLSALPT